MRRLVIMALAAAVAGSAQAQDVPQWSLVDRDGVTLAHTQLQSRAAIVVRCAAGQLSVLMAGVPAPTDRMSVTTILDGAKDLTGNWWLADDGAMLMARRPARYARALASANAVSLMARSEGPPWVVEASLPADRAPIDAVLTACDMPLSDPRDTMGLADSDTPAIPPAGLRWERQPAPRYPDRAISKGLTQGTVVMTCITGPAGALRECRAESELPGGGNFGAEAVRAANDARLRQDTPVGALVEFDIMFLLR